RVTPGSWRPESRPPRARLEARDELAELRSDIDRLRADIREQPVDLIAVLVAHQDDDPRRIRPPAVCPCPGRTVELGLERLGLVVVYRHLAGRDAARDDARQQLADDGRRCPTTEIAQRLLDRHS